ncbi:hypothetical protein AV926_14060 [Myroides marinus]|uniref:N-acetyltransferase domain-containing protein n=1 Tax=Myroides marinus TaxID=703342 RepID=A0A161SBJ6_9FLAO|nr:hypothetical protein [Myroides marinus]KZE77495.1 hypothetical protein AV926_14060 [Myroides marinus]
MFSARIIKEEDYTELLTWWKWHRFSPPLLEMLPNSGVMISKEGVNICAGYIYFTNSKICWIEFIVSNPNYRELDRKEAIKELILQLGYIAKDNGFKVAYTNLKNPSLIKFFSDVGYHEGSINTTEMISLL